MFYESDEFLLNYKRQLKTRYERLFIKRDELAGYGNKLTSCINNHLFYGVHKEGNYIVFREWAPNATSIHVIGDFNNWKQIPEYSMQNIGNGNWELKVHEIKIKNGDLFKWYVRWHGGEGERIPAYSTRSVQDPVTKIFASQICMDSSEYEWKHHLKLSAKSPLIYEVHIGMASEEQKVSDFNYFTDNVLPHIAKLGYNTVQIMALQEHPYYGSFGYQVSGFFALSSRFGTPLEFKRLVDTAHSLGLAVVMDIVHSHAVKNENEGLSNLDGSYNQYFHEGARGEHPAWGTRCFDYGRDEVLFFLLSNCKFWMEEYHLDGFRFDGITSMIYIDHGLGRSFTSYEDYFSNNVDEEALLYLGLANMLISEINPNAITIAEDMSGMPGMAAPINEGGIGFSYRMSMGIADSWIKWIKELKDEDWNVCDMYYQLTNKRRDEKTISYAECHDQAMVGDKTIIFRLLDAKMYTSMNLDSVDQVVERGIALHKLIRLVTIATAGNGYLNFMGNEFGHPEWIDFPRYGNNWSYFYARRQWSLSKNPFLRYSALMTFDKDMIKLFAKDDILSEYPLSIFNDKAKQVMIFKRKGYIFAFNFNPFTSWENYEFQADSGEYKIVMDSDERRYNGFERNVKSMHHFTILKGEQNILSLYLPSRTAVVLHSI